MRAPSGTGIRSPAPYVAASQAFHRKAPVKRGRRKRCMTFSVASHTQPIHHKWFGIVRMMAVNNPGCPALRASGRSLNDALSDSVGKLPLGIFGEVAI